MTSVKNLDVKNQPLINTGNTNNDAKEKAKIRDLTLIQKDYYCINLTNQKLVIGRRFFIKGVIYDIPNSILKDKNISYLVPPLTGQDGKWMQMAVSKYDIDDYTNLYSISEVIGAIPNAIKVTTVQQALDVLSKFYDVANIKGVSKSSIDLARQSIKETGNANVTDISPLLPSKNKVKDSQHVKQSVQQTIVGQPITSVIPATAMIGNSDLLKYVRSIAISETEIKGDVKRIANALESIVTLLKDTGTKQNSEHLEKLVVDLQTEFKDRLLNTSPNNKELYEELMVELQKVVESEVAIIHSQGKKATLNGVFTRLDGELFVKSSLNGKTINTLNTTTKYQDLLQAIKDYSDSSEKSIHFKGANREWYQSEYESYYSMTAKTFKEKYNA